MFPNPAASDIPFPFSTAMSEVTSLHEDDWKPRPSRAPVLTPIRDEEWGRHSPRRREQEPLMEPPGRSWEGSRRPRAHSVDALDDFARPGSMESGRSPPSSRRGRAYTPPRSRSRDDLYDRDARDFPRSRDPHYDDFKPRDRPYADARSHYHHRSRDEGPKARDPQYDGRFLEEALRKKGPAERRRPYKEEPEEEDEAYYPPPAPPPYSETDSQASRERRLKKVSVPRPPPAQEPAQPLDPAYTLVFSLLQNLALSRESLVV